MRRSGLGLALTLLSCQRSELSYVVPPPPVGSGPVILVVEREGSIESVLGAPGPELGALAPVTTQRDEPIRLYAFGYDQPLESFGLQMGPLRIDPSGRLLPPANVAYTADLGLDPVVRWEVPEGPVLPSLRLAIAPSFDCPIFEATAWPTANLGTMSSGVAWGEEALVFTEDGHALAVTQLGPRPLEPLGIPVTAAFGGEDGTLWVGDQTGILSTGRYDNQRLTFSPVASTTLPSPIRRLAAAQPDPQLELYTLGDAGNLEVYRGGAFSLLTSIRPGVWPSPLLWISPGQALYASPETTGTVVGDPQGQVLTIMLETHGAVVTAFGLLPGGLLAGTERGETYLLDFQTQSWKLDEQPLPTGVSHLLGDEEGAFVFGSDGELAFRPGDGRFCPTQHFGFGRPTAAVVLGRDLVVGAGVEANGQPLGLYYLTRVN